MALGRKTKPKARSKPKIKKNTKVRNATPYTYNKITFKSKLEVFMYKLLEAEGWNFGYETVKYTVLTAFSYGKEKVRAITYKPDFVLTDIPVIVETKGFATEPFKLRWKLFKRHLVDNNNYKTLYMPHNQEQCRQVIEDIRKMHYAIPP